MLQMDIHALKSLVKVGLLPRSYLTVTGIFIQDLEVERQTDKIEM